MASKQELEQEVSDLKEEIRLLRKENIEFKTAELPIEEENLHDEFWSIFKSGERGPYQLFKIARFKFNALTKQVKLVEIEEKEYDDPKIGWGYAFQKSKEFVVKRIQGRI